MHIILEPQPRVKRKSKKVHRFIRGSPCKHRLCVHKVCMRAIVLASMGFVSPNPLVEASPKPLCRTAGEGTILTRRIE